MPGCHGNCMSKFSRDYDLLLLGDAVTLYQWKIFLSQDATQKRESKLVDGVATEEMSKEQLEELIVRLREELDQEREERNYFQMERDKTHSFWEITRRQLDEKKSELRNKDREMEEAEELHQVEIKVYKQKVKHLLYEHQNNVTELKAEGSVSMKLAKKEHHHTQESTLCRDMRRLQVEIKEQELANEMVIKSLKKKHEEIGLLRKDFERQVKEMKVKYDKMRVLRDELELRRKREIHEVEERKNEQINTLMKNHEKAFSDIKKYYNDITVNNLALKEQMEEMKEKEERLEKEMADVQLQNLLLVQPLQKAREEIADLNKQLANYEKDKVALVSTKLRLKSTAKELNDLKWQHEVLEQSFEKIQSERDELYRKFTAAIQEGQQKSGFKNLIVERKLLALGETLEKEAQLNEVLAASNFDPTALSTITRKLEDILDAKNNAIKDLQYELARVCKKEFESHKTKRKGDALKLHHYPKEYFDLNPYITAQPLPPLKETARAKKSFIPSSPAKQAAGMKAETFNPYPSHSNDLYAIKFQKPTKLERTFLPPVGPKCYPT